MSALNTHRYLTSGTNNYFNMQFVVPDVMSALCKIVLLVLLSFSFNRNHASILCVGLEISYQCFGFAMLTCFSRKLLKVFSICVSVILYVLPDRNIVRTII